MYLPIQDYAVIGDTHTAALINSRGWIDWACLPHFDSPAVFLRLLDDFKGGYCAIEFERLGRTSRRYLEATNILETTFTTETGSAVVTDFMPVRKRRELHPTGADIASDHRIIRRIRCTSGTTRCVIHVRPTFSFATERADLSVNNDIVLFKGSRDGLHVQCPTSPVLQDGIAHITLGLTAGDVASLVLTYSNRGRENRLTPEEIDRALAETRDYWNDWSRSCDYAYQGEYRDAVLRSALTLKLLTFEPTGAIVAAATTSLPEQIGGIRNWDYRFTWLRDSTFTLLALMNLGYFGEAHDFMHFCVRACRAGELQILYTIEGKLEAEEKTLDHLEGYRGSRPVRVGNAAATQGQLDIYGEILDSAYLFASHGAVTKYSESLLKDLWPMAKRIAETVVLDWRHPDAGIWEVRGGDRHFVHSKAMCWVALARAMELARLAGVGDDISRWTRERDAIMDSLLREGFNRKVGAFVQSYGSTALDASILRLPLLGVIPADNPRMLSTIEQIEKQLARDGLVYRYVNAGDGLPGGEGTFAICTFWLIQNYAVLGRLQQAEEMFRHVLSFGNDLGLFSEEIEPATGEQLGNFPQAFTHIALINTAVRLEAARTGRKPDTQAIMTMAIAGSREGAQRCEKGATRKG
jgi:GH15 family glucan-1,4-alpha-glucosidase